MNEEVKSRRYLAIDGGGTKGLISAVYLSYIEYQTGVPISRCFDIIAGSSSGGILATILSLPRGEDLDKPMHQRQPKFSAFDAIKIYGESCSKIFNNSFWQKLKTMWGLLGPKYDSRYLEKMLDELADVQSKELLTEVIMTAYNLEAQSPEVFNNKNPKDAEMKVKEMTLSTSAAPTFFKPHRIHGRGLFVDGAVYAPTPANWLLMGIERLISIGSKDLRAVLDRTTLVSIGTGSNDPENSKKFRGAEKWGLFKWLFTIFGIFDDSVGDAIDNQTRRLLGDRHYRINVKFEDKHEFPIDTTDKRSQLIMYNKTKESIINPDFQDIKDLVEKIKKELQSEGSLPEHIDPDSLIPFGEWERIADAAFEGK